MLSGSALENVNDSVESGSSAENDTVITVAEVTEEKVPLQFFPSGSLINDLELYNYATIMTNEYLYIQCKINWDQPKTIDTSIPGRKTLKGYLIPPEGCIFENNYKPYVEIPIIVYDESGEGTETLVPPAEIDYYNDNIIIVTPGTDISSYLETEYENPIYTQKGDYFYCNVEWENISSFTETGYHNVKGTLHLPKGIKARNEDDAIVYKKFYVMKDDKIYIEPYYIRGNSLMFPWLKEITDPENIEFYYSFDGEN